MTEAETLTVPGSIAEFIEKHGITGTVVRVDKQPGYEYHRDWRNKIIGVREKASIDSDSSDKPWEHYAWQVSFDRGTPGVNHSGLTTPYKTGIGHVHQKGQTFHGAEVMAKFVPTPPSVEDVLDSLASEAAMYDESRDFEDFCANLGYDTDSRRAERIYNELGEVAKRLRFFLGREAYDELLYRTERL